MSDKELKTVTNNSIPLRWSRTKQRKMKSKSKSKIITLFALSIFLFSCGSDQREADKKYLVGLMLEKDYARMQSDAECFVEFLDALEDLDWQVLMNDIGGVPKYDVDEGMTDWRIAARKIKDGNRFCNTFLR